MFELTHVGIALLLEYCLSKSLSYEKFFRILGNGTNLENFLKRDIQILLEISFRLLEVMVSLEIHVCKSWFYSK